VIANQVFWIVTGNQQGRSQTTTSVTLEGDSGLNADPLVLMT
jgi:hypothetical protein